MKKKLLFEDGIIDGDKVRDIIKVIPSIENSFKQRKQYDEYYYDNTEIEVTIDLIDSFINNGYEVVIRFDSIIIK